MHEETLAKSTRRLFDKLAESPWISDFYLAGGTALAMRLGHRISVNLDFFSEKGFNEAALIDKLVSIGDLRIFQKASRSVTGSIDEVKVSFLGYEYPILTAGTLWSGVTIASMEDIACMKLDALSSRGTKRDFIDLYFIAEQIPLARILKSFERKYASIKFNVLHIKKSLVYFRSEERR